MQYEENAIKDNTVVHGSLSAAPGMSILPWRQPDGDFLPEFIRDRIVFPGHGESSLTGSIADSHPNFNRTDCYWDRF